MKFKGLRIGKQREERERGHIESDVITTSLQFRHAVRQIALSLTSDPSSKGKILKLCDDLRADFRDLGIEVQDKSGKTSWHYHTQK